MRDGQVLWSGKLHVRGETLTLALALPLPLTSTLALTLTLALTPTLTLTVPEPPRCGRRPFLPPNPNPNLG